MTMSLLPLSWTWGCSFGILAALEALGCALMVCGVLGTSAAAAEKDDKHIIGATAVIRETSSGIPFKARIDTGARSCALHVEKLEIPNPEKGPHRGKMARFLIKNNKGESEWLEKKIVAVVRVKSSSLKDGRYDKRFKVRLNLKWKNFEKEVSVSLDDRGDMLYPLLIGRNFLRDDFLVDVSRGDPDVKKVIYVPD